MQDSHRCPHRFVLLVGSVAAVAAAVSGSLPGWSPSGQWQSGNIFPMQDAPGANYFRFLPWTRKQPTTSATAADCTQNIPGVSSDGVLFSVRRSICGNTDRSSQQQPVAIAIRNAEPVAAASAQEDRCTQTLEGVGADGQLFAIRKNVCTGESTAVEPDAPELVTDKSSAVKAVPSTAVPTTAAAATTAVGHLAPPPTASCIQTVEEPFEECREEVACKTVKSLVCNTVMKKVCTMMEERCEPARCLEVLRAVCEGQNCVTKLVRECGQRVNCTGGMSEECGEVPEQQCSLQDQEECARTPVCSPSTRQVTKNIC